MIYLLLEKVCVLFGCNQHYPDGCLRAWAQIDLDDGAYIIYPYINTYSWHVLHAHASGFTTARLFHIHGASFSHYWK